MKRISGVFTEDLVLNEDCEFTGLAHRDIIVMPGMSVRLTGICSGNIILRDGAKVEVTGFLDGKIIKQFDEKKKKRARTKVKKEFAYEFTKRDLKRTQLLLNELRELISESKEIDEAHRYRLLAKLEAMQSELHKRVSNFDRFWGFFVESGLYLGKFGKAVKPLTDRIKELAKILLKTQSKAERLPAPPELPLSRL